MQRPQQTLRSHLNIKRQLIDNNKLFYCRRSATAIGESAGVADVERLSDSDMKVYKAKWRHLHNKPFCMRTSKRCQLKPMPQYLHKVRFALLEHELADAIERDDVVRSGERRWHVIFLMQSRISFITENKMNLWKATIKFHGNYNGDNGSHKVKPTRATSC